MRLDEGAEAPRHAHGHVVNGMLVAALSATALALAAPAVMAGATRAHARTVEVSTAKVTHVGTVLTTGAGLTLYHFEKDPVGHATCTGACAKIWPPYLAAKGAHVKGPKGVKGLSLMKVGGGHWQVAFHHVALYRFDGDKKKGQAKGQGFLHMWFVALKSGIPASPAPAAAPPSPTTQPVTPITQAPPVTTTPVAPAPTTPATAPPTTTLPMVPAPTTPATAPPTTAPPPRPPTTTTTSPPSGGGVSF
jgi:predicted lipoprotein with Yx(FWY)xxD motif